VKDLVVYYSNTGKTEMAAHAVAQALGADLRRLVEKRARRGLLGFLRSGFEARTGVKSELVNPDYSLEGYDRIILCQPFWASSLVPAMNRYLSGIEPKGKRFALLLVKGGSEAGAALAKMRAGLEARGGKVVAALDVQAGMGPKPDLEKAMVEEVRRWASTMPL
jgi:flavodoxin